MVPRVHLNGTSKGELLRQLVEVSNALLVARQRMIDAAPHGRDYYTIESVPFAYNAADIEHRNRLLKIDALLSEYRAIFEAVETQGGRQA